MSEAGKRVTTVAGERGNVRDRKARQQPKPENRVITEAEERGNV